MQRGITIGRLGRVLLLIAGVWLLGAERADARLARANVARSTTASAATASNSNGCGTVQPCCPQPCKPPVKLVLKGVNPCTCCCVEVPVCLPACCEGCPTVSSRCGLFCRGVVRYDWCCGYSVVVRFHRCGAPTVIYRG